MGRYGAIEGLVSPMSSGAFTEWLPTFGESWQTPQVPVIEDGTATPLANVWLFSPATPLIVNVFVLKIAWPRAMALRAAFTAGGSPPVSEFHASKMVKMFGLKSACVGLSPTGSLMARKNV